MTSFVHVDQPQVHPGVQRAEVLFDRFNQARSTRAGSRHLLALLLIAVVAVALVVADTLVSNWNEGRLLAAWMVFCGALFAAVALYADVIRGAALRVVERVRGIAARQAAARADARFLATAQNDPRVMQELQAAMSRRNSEEDVASRATPAATPRRTTQQAPMPTLYEAMRRLNASRYY